MNFETNNRLEMRAIIKGHVQGVGFRALTRHHATILGLKGMVLNLDDGTVKIVAQGSKVQLEDLIRNLKEHTKPGQIKEILLEYHDLDNLYDAFQ